MSFHFARTLLLKTTQNQNPLLHSATFTHRLHSTQSRLSKRPHRTHFLSVLCPPPHPVPSPQTLPNPDPDDSDFITISNLLANPSHSPGPGLENALNQTGIKPGSTLIQSLFNHFGSSPKPLFSLYLWAEKHPEFRSSVEIFNDVVQFLAKSREFDSAWAMVLDRIGNDGVKHNVVSFDTFVILIRRYCRAGMHMSAIRTYDFACSLDLICDNESKLKLFEILLDSLCKEGHVGVASEHFGKRREMDPNWLPSIRVYNILLNGWFRARKLKHAERLWGKMKNEKVVPSIVTYGTLVEGYCRMRRIERAMELVDEMRGEGIEPNHMVYNPIVDALAEEGRFKEAFGLMERFLVLELGPNISTYNSLVKGLCKARDIVGANKVLKMMVGRGVLPTLMTYNYLFKYFAKFGKIEEAMNLYNKIIESGYAPDKLTFHLLVKMLCEQERLELTMQVIKEMRARGFDLDLATSTMLVHLLCKMHRLHEASAEFEDMFRRGIVPQYLTFVKLNDELKKRGMTKMARMLSDLMASVPHSTNLPDTFVRDKNSSRAKKISIMQKAEAMSNILSTCNDPRELVKQRRSTENAVSSANQLMEDIKKRVNGGMSAK
ncbi:Pentatricopeptide repeat [Dillenia turbinata]|uniref:Pentatricopeptide repeat n=1 Tax=Dillenia turbinata TaxID=194707 RepID=A0AAN8YRJ2_9MAGN